MNSYPVHFLSHHLPLLFVAGLETAPHANPVIPSETDATETTSELANSAVEGSDTSTTRPSRNQQSTDQSAASDEHSFSLLHQRLRATLGALGPSKVWEPIRANEDENRKFRVIMVDKDVRFPPSKIPFPSTSTTSGQVPPPPRSPLSPLTPSSPLYPDGLIAPIWVRKHTDLVPAVFVLFLQLKESSDPEVNRAADEQLIKDLMVRRKALNERGIKLTVVLLASRELLDDTTLDPRLSQIRRQSSLDSRASLFVLTPVSTPELVDFVQSLQGVLYEPALDYYHAHSKRVRRKRGKLGNLTGASGGLLGPSAGTGGKLLSKEGWAVRYEFKAGVFAEIMGELDAARKYYLDCHAILTQMFHSTSLLPPRTKRWAESKVLADCVAVKVCKFFLYQGDTSRALGFFRSHLKAFEDLSKGWGIGEETFEFWSWVARQYRIFAELLELAYQAGNLIIPVAESFATPSNDQVSTNVLNPATTLQHPGFYFYTAARCTVRRRECYEKAIDEEKDALESESGAAAGFVNTSPGFANEKKTDHSALIIELYTKSYELLKTTPSVVATASPNQTRTTLYIAFLIAEAYHLSGQHNLALRFFDRISKLYRKEHWTLLGSQMRKLWVECAKEECKWGTVIKLAIEGLGEGEANWEILLREALENPGPTPQEKSIINLGESSAPLLEVSSIFYLSTTLANNSSPYQVHLHCPLKNHLHNLPFSSIRVEFSDKSIPPVLVKHTESESKEVQLVSPDEQGSGGASLRWNPGSLLVISGKIDTTGIIGELQVSTVVLELMQNDWVVELRFDLGSNEPRSALNTRWLTAPSPPKFVNIDGVHPSFTVVKPKPHMLDIMLHHTSPAYMDEKYPISIDITNSDDQSLNVWLDVLLYPSEDQLNTITLDESYSSSIIKQVSLGSLSPTSSISKTLFLHLDGIPGDRILDFSIQSRPTSSIKSLSLEASSTPNSDQEHDVLEKPSEIIRTISIPCVHAISASFTMRRNPPRKPLPGLLDTAHLNGEDVFESVEECWLSSKLEMVESEEIVIENIEFKQGDRRRCRNVFSSLSSSQESIPGKVWKQGHVFSVLSSFDLALPASLDTNLETDSGESPGWFDITWRRKATSTQTSKAAHTLVPLPAISVSPHLSTPISIPSSTSHLSCTLSVSNSDLRLLQPALINLTIHNQSPSYAPANLQIQVDSSDAFAWSGPRQAALPILLAGQSTIVRMKASPLRTGWVKLPRVRVWEVVQSAEEGEEAETEINPVRVDRQGMYGDGSSITENGGGEDGRAEGWKVFVLPV